MKVERLPAWQFRRFNANKREAFNRLRWYDPPPAERARLKEILGWKRTREETVALAREMLSDGLLLGVVADRLRVDSRYLKRLLATSETYKKDPQDPLNRAADSRLSCETRPGSRRPPLTGFASVDELDAWLDAGGAA